VLALSSDGAAEFTQIIEENFGGSQLTLADLDKVKIPSGGATSWSVMSAAEEGEVETKELQGIIIAWADKKSWWVKSYAESGGKEQPDCKSNDMVHGIGNPNKHLNQKEEQLVADGKANAYAREVLVPDSGGKRGFLCATCPHNVFGSAPQGGGKACQDKRFILFLPVDSVLPVLIRVPATSITPIKDYFKRLASSRLSYLGVITGLSLVKIKAAKDYSQIVPKMVRKLSAEETKQVRELRVPFQMALDADDAIEQGYAEKDVTSESLDDMPTHTGGAEEPVEAGVVADGDPF
jgi:hypothetical protein